MEKTPGFFVQCKDINSFCWNLRDELDAYISSSLKPGKNLSTQENGAVKREETKTKSYASTKQTKILEPRTRIHVTSNQNVVDSYTMR